MFSFFFFFFYSEGLWKKCAEDLNSRGLRLVKPPHQTSELGQRLQTRQQ